jgi:PRTRC genetic system protein A
MYLGHPMTRPERLYDYVIAAQGIIKRVETPYASADLFLAPLQEELIGLRLQPYPLQALRLKVPRIPGNLLLDTLADARRELHLECFYQFRYDPAQGWAVTRPEQRQSWARVGYHTPDPANVVLELHSHNTMPAFFSGTDNADERGGRFYAVIGHLDRPHPELALRMGLYGHWLANIPALTVFDDLGPLVEVYTEETAAYPNGDGGQDSWLARLTRRWRSV